MRILVLIAAMAIAVAACETGRAPRGEGRQTHEAGAVEEGPLLLLDDAPEPDAPGTPVADNGRCHVCHMNYMEEALSVSHARAGVGCADCHGDSDAHIDDESWASGGKGTPPDRMFPGADVNPFCMGCHSMDTLGVKPHKAVLAGAGKTRRCTDCHGDHRLAHRQWKWR